MYWVLWGPMAPSKIGPNPEPKQPWSATRPHICIPHPTTPLPFHFPLFFFLIFSRRGEPLPGFPIWFFVAAQAAARFGRSGTSEEGAGRTPQLLSKGNIVLIRNRKRAFLLCTCSAVLIYQDLRWNSEIHDRLFLQKLAKRLHINN